MHSLKLHPDSFLLSISLCKYSLLLVNMLYILKSLLEYLLMGGIFSAKIYSIQRGTLFLIISICQYNKPGSYLIIKKRISKVNETQMEIMTFSCVSSIWIFLNMSFDAPFEEILEILMSPMNKVSIFIYTFIGNLFIVSMKANFGHV